MDLADRFGTSAALLAESFDLLAEPALDREPAWPAARGWRDYLLALDEHELEQAEHAGVPERFLTDPACPPSLHRLAAGVAAATLLPRPAPLATPSPGAPPRGTSQRKRRQIEALLGALAARLPAPRLVVDVGAGHGHFTTRVGRATGAAVLGLEVDPARVEVAQALADGAPVRFLHVDVLAHEDALLEAAAGLGPDALLTALHGCGALGDAVVRAAVATRARVLLVACCAQKIRGPRREPLCATTERGEPVPAIPQELLGLANLLPRAVGVERPLGDDLASRARRVALRLLLRARGVTLPPGEEMRGLNRRVSRGAFARLAERALTLRGLPPPDARELELAESAAARLTPRLRRLALPRALLGRLLEVHIACDRALFLQRAGYRVDVVELFPPEVSPRNVAVLGEPA